MIYNNVRKHEVACLREHIGTLLMVCEQGAKPSTSGNILTEVHSNG
jgi:hypothetical protein